ncbi:membrane progestin receptor gamma [Caerostris darwini]|uniref:Membrane progestin receptor gamma n=1 Tax=Caerostris darwini TaxID=1538125 RepID=A0AAV4SPL2_9ARAC|nr:membrane progestin receptor gamma [Caerostris darwini]
MASTYYDKLVGNQFKKVTKLSPVLFRSWIYVQTKFNLFMSKLCLSEETKNFFFFNAYKTKMSQVLNSAPNVSLYKEEEIPPHLREVAILTGYRSPSSSVKECALSKFDFFGNSHQLLHISGIMATHHQMSAVIVDMKDRRVKLEEKYPLPEFWSIHIFSLVLFSITSAILIFIIWARHYEKNRMEKRQK